MEGGANTLRGLEIKAERISIKLQATRRRQELLRRKIRRIQTWQGQAVQGSVEDQNKIAAAIHNYEEEEDEENGEDDDDDEDEDEDEEEEEEDDDDDERREQEVMTR